MNTITNNDMSFAEKGIKPQGLSKDGKRFFRNREVQAMEILNRPLQVLDFEPNITTSHGPGRYAVLVMMDGDHEPCKFVTNSLTIKEVLDKAREHDDRLQQLLEMVEDATAKAARSGESFNPADLELVDDPDMYELFDVNRLYAIIDRTDTVLIQYHVFDNILQPASYFLGKDKPAPKQ